jgi:hypothetical protein
MTDAQKPQMTPAQSFHRAATCLPLDDIKAGMKACQMLKALAEACVKARSEGHSFTPESLLDWLTAHEFDVEGTR